MQVACICYISIIKKAGTLTVTESVLHSGLWACEISYYVNTNHLELERIGAGGREEVEEFASNLIFHEV